MAADGLEPPTTLTRNRHRDQSPTWSPGGERIAFTSCGGGNLEVWMMDGSGGDGRPVTRVPTEAVRADRLPAPEDSLAIVSAVEGYVRGWRDGDVARLGEVLAPEGVIIWTGSGGVRTMTFQEALANRRPNPGFGEPWRLEALRVVDGRMAVAEVDIAFGEGEGQYTDVLTLYKTDGRWWIVGKAYSLRRGG
jgi:dipeptidyl aminopeptidase/acylaminoacyl peptidase